MGRPTIYSDDLAAEIAYRMIEGNASLKDIAADEDMPSVRSMVRWCLDHPPFNVVLAQARMLKADNLVDEAVPIADEVVTDLAQAARNRLRVQARLDAAAKLWPAKYSAKLNIGTASELPRYEEKLTDIDRARRLLFGMRFAVHTLQASEEPSLPLRRPVENDSA